MTEGTGTGSRSRASQATRPGSRKAPEAVEAADAAGGAPGAGPAPSCAAAPCRRCRRDPGRGRPGLGLAVTRPWASTAVCSAQIDHPEWSVARRWDEALLDAIRRALPNPPVHARNLFHTSVAMWDAWAAYDPTATGYIVNEKHTAGERGRRPQRGDQLRRLPRAFVALHQGGRRRRVGVRVRRRDGLAVLPLSVTTTDGDSPAAVGNRIAAAVIAYGLDDGSNQANGYAVARLQAGQPAARSSPSPATDDDRSQPLAATPARAHDQPERDPGRQRRPAGRRAALGPRQGLRTAGRRWQTATPIDPGPPPRLGDPATDQAYKDQAVEVIRDSAALDPASATTIDISPGARGNNPLGTNDGTGHPVNPATGSRTRPTW